VKVGWTPGAQTDLHDLQDHIAQDSPTAADLVSARIKIAVAGLADNPLKGRKARDGSGKGIYELVIPRTRYTAAYRITGEVIEILALVHQSRLWQGGF
jgi:toxin ParE1/3/4